MIRPAKTLALFALAVLIGAALWFGLFGPGDPAVPNGASDIDVTGAERPGENHGSTPATGPETENVGGGTSTERRPEIGESADGGKRISANGFVVNEQGAAVTGAHVAALRHRQAFVTVHEPLGIEATSSGDGSFVLVGLPAAETIALSVSKDGFASRLVAPIRTPGDGDFTIPRVTLERGLRLTGTVRSASDVRPLAGAIVTVSPDKPLTSGVMSIPGAADVGGTFRAEAGARGRFSIGGLAYSHYRIEARAPGHAPAVLRRSFIASRGRAEIDVSLTLTAAGEQLEGVVVDEDGAPIADASVRAEGPGDGIDSHLMNARSGSDGSFVLRELTRAPYRIFVNAIGYHLPASVEATPGDAEVRLVLAKNGSIRGRAVLAGGRTPASFTVRILRSEGAAGTLRPVKRAIPDGGPGSFVATDLPPGAYVVEIESTEAATTESETIELAAGADVTGVIVALVSGGTITGRVLDEEGGGLAGASVLLVPGGFDPSSATAEVIAMSPHLGRATTSASGGRFRLEHVAAGSFGLRITRSSGGGTMVLDVAVSDSESTDIGDVTVVPGGRLEGVALDVEGAPMAGARVIAVSRVNGHRQSASCSSVGRFAMESVPAGRFILKIEIADRWRSLEMVSDTEVVVPSGGTAEATVRMRRR